MRGRVRVRVGDRRVDPPQHAQQARRLRAFDYYCLVDGDLLGEAEWMPGRTLDYLRRQVHEASPLSAREHVERARDGLNAIVAKIPY